MKSKGLAQFSALVAFLCLIGVATVFAAGDSTKPIKVGLINMRTGVGSIHAIHVYHALKLAVDEINRAGGLLGREVDLVEEDSHTEVDLGLQKLKKLIEEDKVDVTFTFQFANILHPQMEIADAHKHLLLNGELCEGNYGSHYWFNNGPQPNQWIYPIMDWAASEVGKKVYFIGEDYAWGRGSLDAARKHLSAIGAKLVGEEYYPMGTTDWAPAIQKIVDANPDWILPMVPGNDYVVFLKQFFGFGLKNKIIVANTIFSEEDSPAFPPDIREGLTTVSTYFMTLETPENKDFIAKVKSNFGKDVIMTNFGENYYSMFYMWANAVKTAQTTETEAVIKVMEKQGPYRAPQGRITIDPKTHAYVVNAYLGKVNADGSISVIKSLGEVKPAVEIPVNAMNPASTSKNPNP